MKFSIEDFFSKCDYIRRKLRIWWHLLKKSLMENFIFCAVQTKCSNERKRCRKHQLFNQMFKVIASGRLYILSTKQPFYMWLRVRSGERRNGLMPDWDFKPAWKQVLLTWRFISAAFQNDPILWWICVSISFWVVFPWYFNEILFLVKMTIMKLHPQWVSNAY